MLPITGSLPLSNTIPLSQKQSPTSNSINSNILNHHSLNSAPISNQGSFSLTIILIIV